MHIFYIPGIDGNEILMNEVESKHAVRVLRLNQGDKVKIADGAGNFYTAEITEPNPKRCKLSVISIQKEYEKRPFYLHMAVAPTKNIDRYEWFLEKATEIGLDEKTPLLCEHSERKVIKPERLEKILVSAMKQSVKAYLPKLNSMTSFDKFILQNRPGQKFIAHCHVADLQHLKDKASKGSDVTILIGPEGDFSLTEVSSAKDAGFTEISLGKSRLRTETAGVAACHIVNLANE